MFIVVKSKIVKHIDYICQKLKSKYEIVETFASVGPNSIRDYVVQNAGDYDLVVASGGDGSINEVINGLMMIKNRPTLAYVPTGTCNDTGKTFRVKEKLEENIAYNFDGE